jgi:hypothetical protein
MYLYIDVVYDKGDNRFILLLLWLRKHVFSVYI